MILISIHILSNTPITYFLILFTIDVLLQFVNFLFILVIIFKLNQFYRKKTATVPNGIDDLIENAFHSESENQPTTFRCDTSENNEKKLNNDSTISSAIRFDSELKIRERQQFK